MLVSGLWKLVAMAGVIGVGLVAVYQAQKGMDKPASVSAQDSDSESDPGEPPDLLAKVDHSPFPLILLKSPIRLVKTCSAPRGRRITNRPHEKMRFR